MEEEQPAVLAGKRRRGAEASARSEALERLKALRRGGRRSENGGGYSIKMEDPIYDSVPEEEYNSIVARRREEAQGFIVDDDGLGYGDEGEEEDWSKAGLPPSSDDSDGEGLNKSRSRKKKSEKKEKEKEVKKGNASLTAAATAIMGKTKISAMFTSNVFKNRDSAGKVKSFDCDNIVDDVIAEFAPDEADRERRRRGQLIVKNATPIKSESRFFDNGNDANFVVTAELDRDFSNYKSVVDKEGTVEVKEKGEDKLSNLVKEDVVNVLEVKADEVVVKKDGAGTLNAKISEEERDPALSATAGWKEVMSGKNGGEAGGGARIVEEVKSGANCEEQSEFDMDGDGSLPFYILDAHEEIFGANMGTIYLFGKVMYTCLLFFGDPVTPFL